MTAYANRYLITTHHVSLIAPRVHVTPAGETLCALIKGTRHVSRGKLHLDLGHPAYPGSTTGPVRDE